MLERKEVEPGSKLLTTGKCGRHTGSNDGISEWREDLNQRKPDEGMLPRLRIEKEIFGNTCLNFSFKNFGWLESQVYAIIYRNSPDPCRVEML